MAETVVRLSVPVVPGTPTPFKVEIGGMVIEGHIEITAAPAEAEFDFDWELIEKVERALRMRGGPTERF